MPIFPYRTPNFQRGGPQRLNNQGPPQRIGQQSMNLPLPPGQSPPPRQSTQAPPQQMPGAPMGRQPQGGPQGSPQGQGGPRFAQIRQNPPLGAQYLNLPGGQQVYAGSNGLASLGLGYSGLHGMLGGQGGSDWTTRFMSSPGTFQGPQPIMPLPSNPYYG